MKSTTGDEIEMTGVTMAELCRQLSASSDRDVIDKTGMTGVFDIRLDLSFAYFRFPEPPGSLVSYIPTDGKANAIAAQLELNLDPAKGSAELLVIDRVERPLESSGLTPTR